MNFRKQKSETRPVWEWGEDRQIKRISMQVESGVVINNKKNRAYHMIHDFMMRDHIKGGLVILTWQRDAFPKHPFRDIDAFRKQQLDDINQIAKESAKSAKDKAMDDTNRNRLVGMFTILGYTFGITILLGIVFMVFSSGAMSNWKFW